jgi:Zn-dependent protease with chaperone function
LSFLNSPIEQNLLSQRSRQRRKKIALSLLDRFGEAFPEINYELLWESPTVNAQAWRLGPARYVRVYGGLVRHQAITKYGLALMLAHETGHHLGGSPHDPAMPWMSWQGQADYWAARTAMPRIWGQGACGATLRAAREMVELHTLLASQFEDDEPDLSPDCRYRILCSGALGEAMPNCALEAFAFISHDGRGLDE